MTWASRRKFIYSSIVIGIFLIAGFIIGYPYLDRAPTCTDGRQNGSETGVDCGGNCARLCTFEADQLSLLWARSFKIVDGRYNAVAYLENKNQNAAVYKIKYRFRFADERNVYIGSREGETFIPPTGKFAVFEPAINVGHSIPVYTTFEFIEPPVWVKIEDDKFDQLKVLVSEIELINEDSSPKISAKIRNSSLFTIPDLSVIAIVYDGANNAISSSQTFFEFLGPEETKIVNFTWPLPFDKKVIVTELIPMYNAFLAKLN